MSQLIDNLNTIESIKTDIKAAIENKGVDMTGISFPDYASKIGEISVSTEKPEESLERTITSNGSFHYDPTPGSVFSSADITVAIQTTTTVTMTQAQYDALTVKDPDTIYLING